MADDWIAMRSDLHEDPAVFHLARQLKQDRLWVVGLLHRFWSWADSASRDGHVRGVTFSDMDALLGVTGFCAALASTPDTPWLVQDSDGYINIPNFRTWNTQPAKERILATRRKRRQRQADVTDPSRRARDQIVTTVQDSTEEQNNNPPAAGPVGKAQGRKPSGEVQELLSLFKVEYESVLGTPYQIHARDAVALAGALKAFSRVQIEERLCEGLRTTEPFVANSDRSLAFLISNINRPSLRGMPVAVSRKPWEQANNGTGRGPHVASEAYNPHG